MSKLTCSPSCSFFFFLVWFFFLSTYQIRARKLDHQHCPPISCSDNHGPEIRFPFRLQHKSPPNCGYPHPAFQLSCDSQNQTLLSSWPSSPRLVVKDIDYEKARVQGNLTGYCFETFFSNLTLSQESPFRPYDPINRAVLDCSKEIDSSNWIANSCLSSFGHRVYLTPDFTLDEMPLSCHYAKTIEIDILNEYSIRSDHIRLRWEVPLCGECQDDGGRRCYTKNMTTREMGCHPGIKWKIIVTGLTSGLFGVAFAIFMAVKGFYHCLKYSKLEKEYQLKVERFLEDYKSLNPTRYTFHEIKRMTASFKTKLGEGAYGSVFKGELPNGVLVAVKLLHGASNNPSFADGDEFINEVGTIGRIHHVNVVRLLGFCAENLKRALVYEFMPNESLEKFISSAASNDTIPPINMRAAAPVALLGWEKLEEIAIGIARGIEYLHQGCDQRILHFDIKPQNILLDENFVPKVSDFGLAKLCSKGQSIVSVTAARGTMGYIAPEVFSRNFGINVSHKSDVYSFGMLLLEMVGGRKKMIETAANGEDVITMMCSVYFPEWIYKKYLEQAVGEEDRHQMGSGGSTDDHDQVISTHVMSSDHHVDEGESRSSTTINISDKNKELARKLSIVGLWCIQWYPVDRPSIHGVVQMLEGSGEGLTVPPNPFINSSASNPELQESATGTRRVHLSHLTVINE